MYIYAFQAISCVSCHTCKRCACVCATWRMTQMHRMPLVAGLIPPKSHHLQGSFCPRWPIKIRHVQHDVWHKYTWVMPHTWMIVSHVLMSRVTHVSHVTRVKDSCHTCGWVVSHVWKIYDTHVDESWNTRGRVMSHMRTSHITHVDESRHIPLKFDELRRK